MIKPEKAVFAEEYSYNDFNFIIRIIQKEWGLEGEGFCDDLSITGSKAFIGHAGTKSQNQLIIALNNMVRSIKDSLRVYADYEHRSRKIVRRRRRSARRTMVK